jgi:membrane-associated phospholipid phosphatase/uncharacterized protein YneF (UPF0154 family)
MIVMNIPEIDLLITKTIQEMLSNYTPFMRLLSAIGDPTFYIILIILIAWFFDYKSGVKIGLLISFSGLLQGVLKLVFQQPRPYVVSQIIYLMADRAEMGYGLPSGHASVSATLSAYCIFHSKNVIVITTLTLFTILIGLSRICLGVHSFYQVISGWFLGFFIIAGSLAIDNKIKQWVRINGISKIIIPIISASVLIIIFLFKLNKDSMNFSDFIWESELSLVFGLFHGFTTGAALTFKQMKDLNYRNPSLEKKAVKLVVLIVTSVVFVTALSYSEQLDNKIIACSLVYFESFLLGFWVLYIAPRIFKRFSLS